VVGYAADAPGFFCLAGQGGYGIQTSPAAARLAASLALRRGVPEDIAGLGLKESEVSPARLGVETHVA
jgi:D-arginine dehydrogenase